MKIIIIIGLVSLGVCFVISLFFSIFPPIDFLLLRPGSMIPVGLSMFLAVIDSILMTIVAFGPQGLNVIDY